MTILDRLSLLLAPIRLTEGPWIGKTDKAMIVWRWGVPWCEVFRELRYDDRHLWAIYENFYDWSDRRRYRALRCHAELRRRTRMTTREANELTRKA